MKIIIAHSVENSLVASKLKTALSSKAEVAEMAIKTSNGIKSLYNFGSIPVILLLSDNFLKNESCMSDALSVIQDLQSRRLLTVVVADGVYHREGSGEVYTVPTSFERVSNVIQYMNHWQDRYLDLRRQKPDNSEDTVFSEKVRVVRSISSEVGELLRFLRSIDCFAFENLEKEGFKPIFQKLGVDTTPIVMPKVEQKIEKPSESPVAQVVETSNVVENNNTQIPEPQLIESLVQANGSLRSEIQQRMDEMVNNGTDRPSTIETLIEEIKNEETPPPSVTPLTDVTPAPEVQKVLEDVLKEEDNTVEEVVAGSSPQADSAALKALFGDAPTTTAVGLDDDDDDDLDDDDDTEGEVAEDDEEEPQTTVADGHATSDEEGFPHEAEALKAFLASNPEHSAAHCEYAAMMIHEENFGEAQRVLDALFAKQPNNLDVILMLAYLAEQNKDYFKCKQLLEKVTVLNPDFNGIYYKLGVLINQHFKGQKKAAARYFREAIRRDPKNADAHYQYAVIKLEHSGNYVKAIELFLQTLELDPKHSKASFDLAVAFYELGDKANAAKHYARACELNPEFKTSTYDEIFHYEPPQPEPIPTPIVEEIAPKIHDNGIVVMVTGATSGIGKATAARFAAEGYRVIMTGRREDRLAELKENFDTEFKNKNHIISFDVRNLKDVNEVVNTLGEDWQNVDILINNAGLALGFAPIHEGDINDWDTMIDTNIKGLLYMTRAIAPKMVARKRGHIVNICSTAGKEIYPSGNVYCATKVAVDALTKGMRQDLFRHGIRVSQVAPGHVEETEFALVRFHGDAEKANIYEGFSPLKASDVADAIYYAVTRPANVNIQDILIMPTQQAGFGLIEKSGRLES